MFSELVRILRGGIRPTSFEQLCIEACLKNLPEQIKDMANTQLAQYNLIQREIDGRALNFYKVARFNQIVEPSNLLPIKSKDCVLLKIEVETDTKESVNVTLHATGYRVFCIQFSRSVSNLKSTKEIAVKKITQSWRDVI